MSGLVATAGSGGPVGALGDFFDSGAWLVIRNLALFFVAVFWVSVAYWVFKDARRRIEDRWLVAMATLLGLVPPFLGALVYMLFRPPEYLEEVRERELEIKAIEQRLGGRELHCPVCRADVAASYLVCPVCTTRLKQACPSCRYPLEPLWQVCPYCETRVERRPDVDLGDAPHARLGETALRASRPPSRRRRRRAE